MSKNTIYIDIVGLPEKYKNMGDFFNDSEFMDFVNDKKILESKEKPPYDLLENFIKNGIKNDKGVIIAISGTSNNGKSIYEYIPEFIKHLKQKKRERIFEEIMKWE